MLLPFRRNTRQRRKQVQATQSVAGGGSALGATVNYQLDRVGLLNYLVVVLRGTVTLSAGGAFATLGPWSIFDRIRVDLNLGNMNLVDVSGWQLYQLNKILSKGWAPDGGGNYTPSALTFSAPVAMGANLWVLPLIIPISANPGSQFDTGLISLQAPEIQVNVQIRLNPTGLNFVTNFTSLTLTTIELHQCYFEYPDPQFVALPPGQIVRTVEFQQPIVATGPTLYTIDRQGTLMQLNSTIIANGTRSNAIDRMQLVANINDTIYDEIPLFNKLQHEFNYASPSDVGSFDLDLWHAQENPSAGDDRDVIDTEVLTTLQWIATVTAGTTLGSGNNFFNTARRVLVDFAQPGLGPSL
jgi:hypothetical protein